MKCKDLIPPFCHLHLKISSKNLPKSVLLEYIKRQPEIPFPTKICARPVDKMDKKHLIRALMGNYGYMRAPVTPSSALAEALPFLPYSAVEVDNPIDLVQAEGNRHDSQGSISPVSGVSICVFIFQIINPF